MASWSQRTGGRCPLRAPLQTTALLDKLNSAINIHRKNQKGITQVLNSVLGSITEAGSTSDHVATFPPCSHPQRWCDKPSSAFFTGRDSEQSCRKKRAVRHPLQHLHWLYFTYPAPQTFIPKDSQLPPLPVRTPANNWGGAKRFHIRHSQDWLYPILCVKKLSPPDVKLGPPRIRK